MLLDKNIGLRPIGVREVLRRIAGKVVMSIVKDDLTKTVRNLHLCGGQDAGCEAAVYSVHDIFETDKAEAVLLVDTKNAFSSINSQVFLHNIKHICPHIATFVRNCYNVPAILVILGAIAIYGIALTPLLKHLGTCYSEREP